MTETVRIVFVDDEPVDSELAEREVRAAGVRFESRRADGEVSLRAALEQFAPDLVVSDFKLPGFSGMDSIRLTQELAPDVPVVIFTGSIDEETAVACIKAGAVDYVIKEHRSQLGPRVIGALEARRNLKARQRAEKELRDSEARYRLLVEYAPDAMLLVDPGDGRILDANTAAERLTGRSVADLRTLALEALVGPPSSDRPDGDAPRSQIARLEPGDFRRFEWSCLDVQGTAIPCEWRILRIPQEDRPMLSVGLVDLRERRRVEDQLRQAQKMEAVGRLAGGIAHDFNNLLNVIQGYGEIVAGRMMPGDPDRQSVEEMVRAAERGAALTRQLLAFGRRQVLRPRVIDPNAHLDELQRMLGRVIGEDIDLILDLDSRGHLRVDPTQIDQVLLNLAVNARDAMPDGGRLSISTSDIEVEDELMVGREVVPAGRYVSIKVSDTGTGMDPETLARIFEPFFTTKPEGKGTGLGMATVYGIVKQSGGFLWVYSELGRGTVVRMYLPRVDEPVTVAVQRAPAAPGDQGRETVLLVEDEPAARRLFGIVLRSRGYTLLEAGDGIEAAEIAERDPGRIDLLMTDVVLPRLGGQALVERLRAARPDLKVLFVSGYAESTVGLLDGTAPTYFLQKPFGPKELARRVREVLDDDGGRASAALPPDQQ